MKKLLLILMLGCGTGIYSESFGQTQTPVHSDAGKTRTVYLYVVGMDTETESDAIRTYLEAFHEKIVSADLNMHNQMCIIEVRQFTNEDLTELIEQAGYMAFVKSELPPDGQRYIYNPDGTWKIKNI